MIVQKAHSLEEIIEVKGLIHAVNELELGKDYLKEKRGLKTGEEFYLFIKIGDEYIGALRCHISQHLAYHYDYWNVSPLDFDPNIAVVDRLVVKADYRKSKAMLCLAKAIYKIGIQKGVHFCLIESSMELQNIYKRLGFITYREKYHSYGIRFQMSLSLWDLDHLRQSKSFFIDEHKQYLESINQIFTEQLEELN